MARDNPEYVFIENRTQWFDRSKADAFDPGTGEILYFTQKKHFVLYTPEVPGDVVVPEQHRAIRAVEGVTWMQANGFEAEITNQMTKPIQGDEY